MYSWIRLNGEAHFLTISDVYLPQHVHVIGEFKNALSIFWMALLEWSCISTLKSDTHANFHCRLKRKWSFWYTHARLNPFKTCCMQKIWFKCWLFSLENRPVFARHIKCIQNPDCIWGQNTKHGSRIRRASGSHKSWLQVQNWCSAELHSAKCLV